jgi:fengycin family lipopeptide synthetase B
MKMNDFPMVSQTHGEFLESSNLTQNQFLMWMGQQQSPETPLYNMILSSTIYGEIAPETFQVAFQTLVDRTDALRTVIEALDGVPQQRVVPHLPYAVEFIDLSGTSDAEQSFRDWLERRKVRRLDLGVCSFDSVLIKLASERFKWYFSQHHILTDAWSAALIFQQMAHFYQLAREQRLHEAPVLNNYQTYVEYERKFRQTEGYRQAQSYWRDKLAKPIDPFDFFGRALSGRSHRVHRVDHQLGEERTQRLKAQAQEAELRLISQDLTLYTVFLTILFAYLHRIGGQSRLRIGSPFHNRPSTAFKETIGLFIEMGVVQVDISPNETFASLVKKVRNEVFAGLQHAQPGISSAEYNRAYNVLLNYVHATFPDFDGMPTKSHWAHSGYGDSNQGLLLQVHDFDQSDNILLQFEFNEEVFELAQQRRVIEHFLNLFDNFLEDRDQLIGQVDLLSAEERKTIQSFSQVVEVTPAQKTIVECFEAQVLRTPEAIAVVYQDRHLTYAELNRRSNQLAHRLQELGVKRNDFVAMYMDRSLEMVVGILGVLKTGGAYLPLDPAYPAERLGFMLQDSRAPVLLTQTKMVGNLPTYPGQILYLDGDWASLAGANEYNPDRTILPTDVAYVIYTSGSTGTPKGVLVSHGNVVRLLTSTQHWYNFDENDVWALFHSYAFDVSVWELWGALLYGGRLVVVPYWTSRSFEAFYKLLRQEKVTVLNQTPSAFRQLIRAEEMVGVAPDLALRLVICAGEALELQSLRPWFERHPDTAPQVINMYGTTETTVHATYRPIQASDLEAASGSVIGVPIPDLQLYILDPQQQPVPIGVTGEIYVGGAGVSKGYLNRPELTAERFITNPFSNDNDPASRLYRTGDLARFLPERDIEYLGRIDHQVKIRGFRIELGEIETNLTRHPAVRESIVIAHTHNAEATLVAYLVTDQDPPPATDDLRTYLKQSLPDYMLPASFVFMETMPLTPNGKIDRKALPEPDTSRPTLTEGYVAPETEIEETLASIWQEVLGLDKVGRHDNLFDLGGDSIISLQITARASQAGLHLTPKQLFDHQTIAKLAAVVGTSQSVGAEQGLVTGSLPLTPVQRWFFDQKLPEPDVWNMSLLVDLSSEIKPALLEQALQQLIVHHDALRARFLPLEDPIGWQQTIAASAPPPAFRVIGLSGLTESEQEARIEQTIAQLEAGHNLAQGRLVGAAYFKGATHKANQLFITVHHLAIDGFSWHILLQDLERAYDQLSRGDAVSFPAKTISIKEWANGLSELAQSAEIKSELAHWLSVSDDVQPKIPVDYPGGENSEESTGIVMAALDAAQTQSLLKEVPAAYNTRINDVLLTTLAQIFADWTGQSSLLIKLEGHGRENILKDSAPLDRSVGWFTSMFPVKLTLPTSVHPGERLKAIKEQLRAIPNGGIGMGVLRYLCRDEAVSRQVTAVPSPQVMFNYLGQLDTTLSDTALFKMNHAPASWHGARNPRVHVLEINSWIIGGQLKFSWSFSENLHRRETIRHLAAQYVSTLETLIGHCLSSEVGGFTPSDFPLADLDQKQLDQLASILDARE